MFFKVVLLTINILIISINGLNIADNTIHKYFSYIEYGKLQCNLPNKLIEEIQSYQEIVNQISNEILNGKFKGNTYEQLLDLTDTFGPRMSGTEALEKSIEYVATNMKLNGLENVHVEQSLVPVWKRGNESLTMISPWYKRMDILGLGSSIGTSSDGISAEVIAFETFDEFARIKDENVRGKIVLFVPKWKGYGKTVIYRSQAASIASKKGAIAALVWSITPFSLNSPHTGHQSYEEGVIPIPVAAVTVEDAEMMLRMYRKNRKVLVNLQMDAMNYPDSMSGNTIGELQGKVYVNKSVVVVSGHLDSWDVGTGAMDDGGGAIVAWKAVEFLKAMNLRPKRTIRAIFWTAEEQGYVGARNYMNEHRVNEKEEFNVFMELDVGTFNPVGIDFSGTADGACIIKEISKLMTPLNATRFGTPAGALSDVELWTERGFPGVSIISENDKYFWYHHTKADRIEVEDPVFLDKTTALWASTAYIIADLSIDIPRNLT